MGDGAQVHHRLHGVDQFAESACRRVSPPVLVIRAGLPATIGDRVQHDEAGAVGEEIGERAAARGEAQRAVGAADDLGAVGEALRRVARGRVVADAEAIAVFLDREVLDDGIVGAPVPVAHDERDRADHLDAGKADVAQVAGLELRRQRAGGQHARRRHRFIGSEQPDVQRWRVWHVSPP